MTINPTTKDFGLVDHSRGHLTQRFIVKNAVDYAHQYSVGVGHPGLIVGNTCNRVLQAYEACEVTVRVILGPNSHGKHFVHFGAGGNRATILWELP